MTERWRKSDMVPGTMYANGLPADAQINVDPEGGTTVLILPSRALTAAEARAIGVLLIEAAGMASGPEGVSEPAALIDCDGDRWVWRGPDQYCYTNSMSRVWSRAEIEKAYAPVREA